MPTSLYLVRHGESAGNRAGRWHGHTETPLTSLGKRQAKALAKRFAALKFDAVYASDLSRAADTAAHLVTGNGLEVNHDPRLREVNYGEWEALDGKAVLGKNREKWMSFALGKIPAPGGEDITTVRWRMSACFREFAEKHKDGNVLIVSHGSAMIAGIAELLGMPVETTWSFAMDNASITKLEVVQANRFVLSRLNDAAHLEGLK
ncbi:MAG TPA: histidine phosphatase family protein [Dehalococcoidia bacterium]|nr:histidine phosphatase family protein [Dehalococcoidia bacterium]